MNLTLDPTLKAESTALAYSQNETLSSLTERLLKQWLSEQKPKRK